MLLMIYQFTFMKYIHPMHGNMVEIIGAVLCLTGALVTPVKDLIKEAAKRNEDHHACTEKTNLMSNE